MNFSHFMDQRDGPRNASEVALCFQFREERLQAREATGGWK
jgi:hypothetical protein